MKLPASFLNTAATKCMIQLPPLEGTTYDSLFKNVYYPGESLRVTCGEKFWISSSQETFAETTCDDYGQWTIDPVCKGTESQHRHGFVSMIPEATMIDLSSKLKSVPEVFCTNQRGYNVRWWNVWWNQRLRLGDTVEYECVSGYKSPDGSYLAKCTRDEWKPKPLCQGIVNVLVFSFPVRKESVFLISRSVISPKCRVILIFFSFHCRGNLPDPKGSNLQHFTGMKFKHLLLLLGNFTQSEGSAARNCSKMPEH